MTTASPRSKTLRIFLSLTLSVGITALALAQAPASPHDLSDAVLQGDVEKAQQLIAAGGGSLAPELIELRLHRRNASAGGLRGRRQ